MQLAAHNRCDGQRIFNLKLGQTVKLQGGYLTGTYKVSKIVKHSYTPYITTYGPGTVNLRTCNWGTTGSDNYLVHLVKA